MSGESKSLPELYPWPSDVPLLDRLRSFTKTLEVRLTDLDVLKEGLLQTINLTREVALERINSVVTPLVEQAQDELNDIISQVAALQAQVELILAGGLSANNVVETATKVFVTPAQKADIGALRTEMTALKAGAQASLDTFSEVYDALTALDSAKLNVSSKSSNAQALAGADDATWMTPLKVAAAILALAKQNRFARFVILTSSQTWVAPANIKGRVTVVGGSGSGASTCGYPSSLASGGAAGGYSAKAFTANAGASFVATIGAGGASVSPVYNQGNQMKPGLAGGASSFVGTGISITANGGEGGKSTGLAIGTAGSAAGAAGGTATGGDVNYQGGGSGTVSITATSTGSGTHGASGGGAVAMLGTGYSSGSVSLTPTASGQQCGASGGAGVGGASGNITITASTYCASGGGSGSGPSAPVTNSSGAQNGGPDVFNQYGITYAETAKTNANLGVYPAVTGLTPFSFTGRGSRGFGVSLAAEDPDPGCGGGGKAITSNTQGQNSGNGGIFAGGGGIALTGGSSGAGNGGRTVNGYSIGGGGGGASGSDSGVGVTSGAGGTGFIVIEYDLV